MEEIQSLELGKDGNEIEQKATTLVSYSMDRSSFQVALKFYKKCVARCCTALYHHKLARIGPAITLEEMGISWKHLRLYLSSPLLDVFNEYATLLSKGSRHLPVRETNLNMQVEY